METIICSQYIQHPWLGNYFLHPVGGDVSLLVDGCHALLVSPRADQGFIQSTPTGRTLQASDRGSFFSVVSFFLVIRFQLRGLVKL